MATVRQADRLVVLAAGVVDDGTHHALLGRCEICEAYCRQQSVA